MDAARPSGHRPPRPRFHRPGGARIRRLHRPGCRTRPQRVPLVVLYPRGMPRCARERRTSLARHDDGAVLCQGIPPGYPPPLSLLQPLLARLGHHLGRYLQSGLPGRHSSTGAVAMSEQFEHDAGSYVGIDRVPGEPIGEERTLGLEVRGYLLGLALAVALTAASFWAVGTHEIYRPGAAVALLVLAVGPMGLHLVFFLHNTPGPRNAHQLPPPALCVLIAWLRRSGPRWATR